MWLLIEEFLIAFIMLTVVTQILIPVIMNRPTFPIFRWRKVTKGTAEIKEAEDLDSWLSSMVEEDKGEVKDGNEQSSE